jgi:hypothetical protein
MRIDGYLPIADYALIGDAHLRAGRTRRLGRLALSP